MKGREERKDADLEKSNIPGIHKRSKNKDTIESDLTVRMKAARIERQRIKCLNHNHFQKRNA